MARDRQLEERILDVRAVAAEQLEGPILEECAWMICDRCGIRVRVSSDPNRAPVVGMDEWGKGPEGDLCPTCVEAACDG